jgi:hypothetical protein
MPRDAPPAIPLLPSARWATVASYWADPWSDRDQALAKYRGMSEALAAMGPSRTQRLRGIAARWPGSLREAQITEPAAYAARGAAVAEPWGLARSRAWWWEQGRGAIPCWSDLHGLLGDVGRMRRAARDPFAALDPARRRCWPIEPERWPGWVLRRLDARLAIAWLSAIAGVDPAQLDAVLRR